MTAGEDCLTFGAELSTLSFQRVDLLGNDRSSSTVHVCKVLDEIALLPHDLRELPFDGLKVRR